MISGPFATILALRAFGMAWASWSRNFPFTHDTSFTCRTVPVLGAVTWLPFSNAEMATQVQVAPCGIPPFSSHDWPFSALDGWLWVVSLAPKNVGAAAVAAFPDETVRPTNPGDPPDPGTWTQWAQLMPHMLAADLAATDNPALRELVRRACWYLIDRGDARTAQDLMSNLRQQWRDRLGADHPHTLMAAHNLAWALWELGRYAESRDLNQVTLERHRSVLGEDHPDTLSSAHNLALDLLAIGQAADGPQGR